MKKLSLILALLLVVSCVFASCAKNSSASDSNPTADFSPISFTDSAGREITLNSRPTNVAVLFSSYAEIWQIAGGKVKITVGDSIKRGFSTDGEVTLVDDSNGANIDIEQLIACKPDFVIGSADIAAQTEACNFCANAGIPSALFKVENIDDYLSMFKICTDITGNSDAYQKNGVDVAEAIDHIKQTVTDYTKGKEPIKILFVRAGSSARSTKAKTAQDNFAAEIIQDLGTYNIAENAKVLLDGLSLEEIVAENPEYIFISIQGSENAAKKHIQALFDSDGWKDLSAVKNSNYIFLPKDLFHYKPNARWAEAYKYAADILYPELKLGNENE